MSILQKAFELTCGPMQDADLNAFLDYIEPLSHEGVPGEKRWLTLRGVSTTTSYIRLLAEMLEIGVSQGGVGRVSLKGLAVQLGYLVVSRDRPVWVLPDSKPDHYFDVCTDAMAKNFITLLMVLRGGNSDQTLHLRWASDISFEQLTQYVRLIDANYSKQFPHSKGTRQELEEYLSLFTFMHLRFSEAA